MSTEVTIELIRDKQDMLSEATVALFESGFDGVLEYIKDNHLNPDEAYIVGHRVATLAAEAIKEVEK